MHWIHGKTFGLTAKINVEGKVAWKKAEFSAHLEEDPRVIAGNDLPLNNPSGKFPVANDDPAYEYDRNPNSVASLPFSVQVPANPKLADKPSCAAGGEIGFELDGVAFFNALDNGNCDAVAHEILDSCEGHRIRNLVITITV